MARIQQLDDNGRSIVSNDGLFVRQPWTFATATTGATGAHTLFEVTGDVLVRVFGICNTDLTGAGTIEVGSANNTAALLAQIADATDLDDGENWVDATPEVEVSALPGTFIINDGADIILTIGTTAITAGQVNFYCHWRPLSAGASVTAPTPA